MSANENPGRGRFTFGTAAMSDDSFAGVSTIVPFFVTFFLSLIMLLPVGTDLGGAAMPHLAMICVFYFSSRRPLTIPYSSCAAVGLFLDLWLDVPMGLNMLMLLMTRFFVLSQLKHYRGRSRAIYWAVFSLISSLQFVFAWFLLSFFHWTFLPPTPLAVQWLITVFAFAPVGLSLGYIRRGLM